MNFINGTSGDDTLRGLVHEGSGGLDTAVINSPSGLATFSLNAAGNWVVSSPDGVDTMIGIETMQFGDGTVQLFEQERRVNTNVSSDQVYPAIAMLKGAEPGAYAVTWVSFVQDGAQEGVYVQRYHADGTAWGEETLVNTRVAGRQYLPAIAATHDGGYVITWSDLVDPINGFWDIFAQVFNADGTRRGGAIQVNTETANTQDFSAVTGLNGGGFVVTWESIGQDDGEPWGGIYARRFDASGSPAGGEILVNAYTYYEQRAPAITTLNEGKYVISWFGSGDGDYGIWTQTYLENGTSVGGAAHVNSTTLTAHQSESITALSDGGYVVTWMLYSNDGSGWGNIVAQKFKENGDKVGFETRVNGTAINGDDYNPDVAPLPGGGYVVVWSAFGDDGSEWGVYSRRFDEDSNALNSPTLVTKTTAGDQGQVDVAGTSDGYIVTWISVGQDGSGSGVYTQRFLADGTVVDHPALVGDGGNNVLRVNTDLSVELVGAAGNDNLAGGSAPDVLQGGPGFDQFEFAASGNGIDRITDWGFGDHIQIAGAHLTGSVSAGNGATLGPNQVQVANTIPGTTTVYVGTNSFTGADVAIELAGTWDPSKFVLVNDLIWYLNHAPTVTVSPVHQNAIEDSPFSFTAGPNFSDADLVHGDQLSYSATLTGGAALPNWLVLDPNTSVFSGTPAEGDIVSNLGIEVTATDLFGASVTGTLLLTVQNVNDAPAGTVTIDGTPIQGGQLTASDTLTDPDGMGSVTYIWQFSSDNFHWTTITTGSTFTPTQAQVGNSLRVAAVYVDGHGTSEQWISAATAAVLNVNDPPVVTAGNTITYVVPPTPPQAVPITIAAGLQLSDPDNTPLSGATVVISDGQAGDMLAFTGSSGITGSYDAGTHTLTLTGSALAAAYQAVLRTVTYHSSDADPTLSGTDTSRTVSWAANDGIVWSNVATTTVRVDNPPNAFADSNPGDVVVESGVADSAPTTASFSIRNDWNSWNATTPTAVIDFSAQDNGQPLDPIEVPDDFWGKVYGNLSLSGTIFEGFVAYGNSYIAVGAQVKIDVAFGTSSVGVDLSTYQGNPGLFTIVLSTGETFQSSGNHFFGVSSNRPFDWMIISCSNGNMTLDNFSYLANPLSIPALSAGNVLANDTDIDVGDTLTVQGVAAGTVTGPLAGPSTVGAGASINGTYGMLTLRANGDYGYTLDNADPKTQALSQGEPATDVFTYTMRDSAGVTSTATLTILIAGTNDAPNSPTDSDGTINAVAEGAANGTTVGLVATAIDVDGGTLVYTLIGNPGGRFAINSSTGEVTVANGSAIDYEAATSLQITVQVSDGTATNSQNFDIAVTNVQGNIIFGDGSGNRIDLTHTVFPWPYATIEEDLIYGQGGNDTIRALDGNDLLDGGPGNDFLYGGNGNDRYFVDSPNDVVTEGNNQGIDVITTTVSYPLPGNVENLVLAAGLASINGTGNGLGNVLLGNDGANVLDGAQGADSMAGGKGNDTYYVDVTSDVVVEDPAGGTDLVYVAGGFAYTLPNNVENVTRIGGLASMTWGNGLGNVMIGDAGNNQLQGLGGADVLDGKQGMDSMYGGDGNDTYVVDVPGDFVQEMSGGPGGGVDIVNAGCDFSLVGANSFVENLTLTLTGNFNATGNGAANVLRGNAGSNTLDGLVGADSMFGGDGSDTYYVDNSGDVVSEPTISVWTGGLDAIISSVTYSLQNNSYVENLTLKPGAGNLNATGNSLANLLTGNEGNNVLTGGNGADSLIGGNGRDVLNGGAGPDKFYYNAAGESLPGLMTSDVIQSFSVSTSTQPDKIVFSQTFDANSTFGAVGVQPFAHVLNSVPPSSGAAAVGYLWAVTYLGNTTLYGSTDTDTAAEFAIRLLGVTNLTVNDLIFLL
ncbi:MAG: cadherin domain-containing protein [Burkholderiales bacterium]|nr:cadherin domain-containing protein [Burkholderiales bacterium]